MVTIFALLFIAALIGFGLALFKPSFFQRFGKTYARKHLLSSFGVASLVLFGAIGATAPPQTPSTNSSSKSVASQEAAHKTPDQHTTKQVSETKPVAFITQNENDSSLPKGQTQTRQTGKNGVETITYRVNYLNGRETGRTQVSDSVTTPAVPQIVEQGTYVAPVSTYTPPTSSSGDSYTNSNGNTVESPDGNTTGATARCVDGTYSHSQHHSGTCSGHGGVATWL